MTRGEKRADYMKAYRQKNKDKIEAYKKDWHEDNRERRLAKMKDSYKNRTLPYTVVYCIPNYDGLGNNYAGITNNVYQRMANHKNLGKKNIDDWFVLDIKTSRSEALISEKHFHSKGYKGMNNNYIN